MEEFAVHGGDLAAAVALEEQRHGRIPHAFVVAEGDDLRDGAGPRVSDAGDDGTQDVGEFRARRRARAPERTARAGAEAGETQVRVAVLEAWSWRPV